MGNFAITNQSFLQRNDADIPDSLEVYLTRKKYDVVSVSDCRKVVQTVKDEQPDLILMDVNLGFCDGRQLCLQLKNMLQFQKKIILFSSNPDYARSVVVCGADDFIEKPFGLKDFISTLALHLQA